MARAVESRALTDRLMGGIQTLPKLGGFKFVLCAIEGLRRQGALEHGLAGSGYVYAGHLDPARDKRFPGSGGGRESNPPSVVRRFTDFEDRGAHQAPGRLRWAG